MQQPPTGYEQAPQWNGQPQQPVTPNDQWAQQTYPPQQSFPPQQGQFQQPFTPNPQWNQQPYEQLPPKQPETPKPVNAVKSVLIVFGILALIITAIIGFLAITGNTGGTPSSTLSEPDFKASAVHTTVGDLNKDSNQDKGEDVYFNCAILNFVKDSNGNTVGANVDNDVSSGVIQVIFPSGTDLSQINVGDNLDVWGQDQGSFSGTNAFGATIQEVAVGALYMTDDKTGYQTA
ncbi:MAG: hypothetical protein ACXVCM_07335 [Ktedonobacteraceae bacterium]